MILPDAQERLSALTAWGNKADELPTDERRPDQLVPGCVSQVWLDHQVMEGKLRFRLAAASLIVRGLAGVTVRLADGHAPAAIAASDFAWVEGLRLERSLSPTRLNGLASVACRLRQIAAEAMEAALLSSASTSPTPSATPARPWSCSSRASSNHP